MANFLRASVLQAQVAEECDLDIDVVVHESIDSTNSWCLQQSRIGRNLPFACFAEQQTQGRGRRGKNWLMPAGSNIAMSLAWPFVISNQPLAMLPLSIALAIVTTLESYGLQQVQIKWPNDVYVRDKKIAGILIETRAQKSKAGAQQAASMIVVIGVGLNYDMSNLDQSLSNKNQQSLVFTDIKSELTAQSLASQPVRTGVAASLLKNIIIVCQNFPQLEELNLGEFCRQYDYCKDKNIEIILDDKTVLSGVAQGVNEHAELLVLIDGQQRVFNSAEVSVKV